MKYTLQKIFTVAFASVFIVIGASVFISGLKGTPDTFLLLFGAAFFIAGTVAMYTRLKQITRFEKMTYHWYCAQYPQQVQQHKVSCFSCGSPRIQVRALLNRTYHREHFCAQCGTTLYYSPEQR